MRGVVHRERLAVTLAFFAFAFGGYFAIAAATDPTAAASLATPLDRHVPFLPASIVAYAAVYVMITLPVFLVESRSLFRRVVATYLLMVVVCWLCFLLFPVSGASLRPDLDGVATHPFLLWGLRLSYGLDPPVNLFPSLHLAGATLAALSVGKARLRDGLVAGVLVLPVAVSVCTVKQHYWVDAVAGVALAFACFALVLWRFETPPGEQLSRGRAGWVGFGTLVAAFYGSLFVAWRAGLEPWTWR